MNTNNLIIQIRFIALLSVCLISYTANTQELISPPPFKTFEARNVDGWDIGEKYGRYVLDDDGNMIYSTNYTRQFTFIPQDEDLWEDMLDGEYFRIVKKDIITLEEIDAFQFFGNGSERPVNVIYLNNDNEETIEVLAVGTNSDINPDGISFMYLTLDLELNELSKHWFTFEDINFTNIFDVNQNQAGNFVMTAVREELGEPEENFICEFTVEGEMIQYQGPILMHGGFTSGAITQMPGGEYLVHPYMIMDEAFNDIGAFDDKIMVYTNKIIPIDSTRFIHSGTGVVLSNNIVYNDKALLLSDLSGATDTIFYELWPSPTFTLVTRPGIKPLTMVDTNNIYFAIMNNAGSIYAPNDITLHSLRLDGTVNWSYIFGGDAAYFPIDILPMPDDGCLLLVWKIYWEPDVSKYLTDIDYVRFDKDGQVVDVPTAVAEVDIGNPFPIYPNPANEVLFIDSPIQNLNIKLFDSIGRTVFLGPIKNSMIDISELKEGLYVYMLLSKGVVVQTGKVMVEE